LVVLAIGAATVSSWEVAGGRFGSLAPFLAAGFGAQVLLGALSYLVPVALGGGPAPVRAATAVLDRGGAPRVAVVNAGLLMCALPVPSIVQAVSAVLVLAGLASFIPLLFLALRASRIARRAPAAPATEPRAGQSGRPTERDRRVDLSG
jgi:nitrite reductase (NO-forming)